MFDRNIRSKSAQLIQLFEEHQLIQSRYKVVSTKTFYQANK